MRAARMLRLALPEVASLTLNWQARFRKQGLSPSAAWSAALRPPMRRALDESHLEYLPRALRANLGMVVDVGANKGAWVSALLRFVAVRRIEAFEPNPHAFALLSANLKHVASVRLHQAGVGDQAGSFVLQTTQDSKFSSLLPLQPQIQQEYWETLNIVESHDVPIVTLDATLADAASVDLLKIDVQGFERHVLQGARQVLKRTRAVLIETNFISHYQGDDTFASLYSLLTEQYGFAFWNMTPPTYWRTGRALWTDSVFVNPTHAPAGGWASE
ncbi:MAG TPA: FkbM family methyltransferase [Ktedonobacterales bacterium]|nr:FkbM family methyltransferase [Ktedonobacterales bacterium]